MNNIVRIIVYPDGATPEGPITSYELDMFEDEVVELNRTIQNVQDITRVFADFTQEFTLPASPKNNNILKHFYDVAVQQELNQHNSINAGIEVNGVLLATGALELQGATMKENRPDTYSVVFYSALRALSDIMGEDTLVDIDWSYFDSTADYLNVYNSWFGLINNGDVVYPLFDNSRGWIWSDAKRRNGDFSIKTDNNIARPDKGVMLQELKPALRLAKMIEIIFSHYGLSYQSNWLNSPDTQKIFIQPSKVAGVRSEIDNSYNYNVEALGSGTVTINQQVFALDTVLYDLQGAVVTSNDTYSPKFYGQHNFHFWITLRDLDATRAGIYLYTTINGVQRVNYQFIWANHPSGGTPAADVQVYFTATETLNLGDTIQWHVETSNQLYSSIEFAFRQLDGIPDIFGQTVHLEDQMPDMRVSDFISSFISTNNLVLEPVVDEIYNYVIEPIPDWYSDGAEKDWSEYIDRTRLNVDKIPVPRSFEFKHADAEDITNIAFENIIGRKFGAMNYETSVDYADGETNVNSIFTVFPPSEMESIVDYAGNTNGGTGLFYFANTDEDGEGVEAQFTLFYYNGVGACKQYYIQDGVNSFTTESSFPHCSIFSDITGTSSDVNTLSFNLEEKAPNSSVPVNTLFNRYWSDYVESLFDLDTKFITTDCVLPLSEFLNLRLNTLVRIDDLLYTINNIKYNFLNNVASLELISYFSKNYIKPSDVDPNSFITQFSGGTPSSRQLASYDVQEVLGTTRDITAGTYVFKQRNTKLRNSLNFTIPNSEQNYVTYDEETDTYELLPTQDGQVQNLGQELFFNGVNIGTDGATITEPKLFLGGSDLDADGFFNIIKATADNLAQNGLYGLNTTEIGVEGTKGKIVTYGLIKGIDTSGFLVNTQLYASTVAGELTATKPLFNVFYIGTVKVQDGTNGEIFVNTVQAGREDIEVTPISALRAFFSGNLADAPADAYYVTDNDSVVGPAVEQTISAPRNDFGWIPIDTVGVNIAGGAWPVGAVYGQVEFEIDSTQGGEQIVIEVYKANLDGTVVDAGTGLPIGNLGVAPIVVLSSPVVSGESLVTRFINVSGYAYTEVLLNEGQRVRFHIGASKIGGSANDKTFTIYQGGSHETYVELPVSIQAKDVSYENIDSGLLATNVQQAIDEVSYESVKWKGAWIQREDNNPYKPYNQVTENGWLMIANSETTDHAQPQAIGAPSYVYQGNISIAQVLAKQVLFGNRYNWQQDGYIQGWRLYGIAGHTYSVFYVVDPLGTGTVNQLAIITATTTGWLEFTFVDTFVLAGATVDLIAITNETDPVETSWTGNWNYTTPNNEGAPAIGDISQATRLPSSLRINFTDNDGGDRTAELTALTVGDSIDGAGQSWQIQAITQQIGYIDFSVAPAAQGAPTGVQLFTFNTVTAAPIDYGQDPDYWTNEGSQNQGLYIADGDYADVVPDGTARGVDLLVQAANISPDWDFQARTT